MKIIALLLGLVLPIYQLSAGALVDSLQKIVKPFSSAGSDLFVGVVGEKEKQLLKLEQERATIENKSQKRENEIRATLSELKNKMSIAETALRQKPTDLYVRKRFALLQESYQVLNDVQREWDRVREQIDDLVKLIRSFLDDPDLAEYKKRNKLQLGYRSFEDMLKLHDMISDQKNLEVGLAEQKKSINVELTNRKQILASTVERLRKKKEDVQEGILPLPATDDEREYNEQELKEILSLEVQMYSYQSKLHHLQVRYIELKADYLAMRLFVEHSRLSVLRDYLRRVKPSVRVSDQEIQTARIMLAERKKEYYAQKERLRQEVALLDMQYKKTKDRFDRLTKEFQVEQARDIEIWTRDPKKTPEAYRQLFEVATLSEHLNILDKHHELLEAQIALADEKFEHVQIEVQAKESYRKITTRGSIPTDELVEDIKLYTAPRAKAKASSARYKERMSSVADLLNIKKRVLDTVQQWIEQVQLEKTTIFKSEYRTFVRCVDLLQKAQSHVKGQIDMLGKLTGVYSGVTATVDSTIRLIDFITNELSSLSGVLSRAESAISWEGIKSAFNDVRMFVSDIRAYLSQVTVGMLAQKLYDTLMQPWQLFAFMWRLLLIIGLLLLWMRYVSVVTAVFNRWAQCTTGFIRFGLLALVVVLTFTAQHISLLAAWMVTGSFFLFGLVRDPFLYGLFYLVSIVYWLYLQRRFMVHVIDFNERSGYEFLSAEFQHRFTTIGSFLISSTIVIFFSREAFLLGNYYTSELPIILLTLNLIILQVSLILLLTKEQILNIIPYAHNEPWKWIRAQVDRFYYPLLCGVIVIIIMSNPYVGFERLVVHVVRAVLLTLLLVIAWFWLNSFFKKIASQLFFLTNEDVPRERFGNAKTVFGLFIVTSFLTFSFIGLIVGASIWGWHIQMHDVVALLKEPLMGKGTTSPVTVLSIVEIIGFILAGFAVSYALTTFVLNRIFSLLLVDSGVQYTVTSISRYVVVIIAILFGFKSVGLGEQATYLFVGLTLSIGWVLRDPISDFAAYFIILVQRPIKIGDYISLDTNINGVVRKITPRSVVLRRRNSTTIVVPNSQIMTRTLENWNYTRNFFAFEDILVTIDYSADPSDVAKLLMKAVESHPNILRNPKPIVRLDSFGEYGYVFMVRGYMSSIYTLEMWDIASDIRFTIVRTLAENNLRVAVPVRIVRQHGMDAQMRRVGAMPVDEGDDQEG